MAVKSSPKTKDKGTRASKIPVFKTIREEAEFWDTHDVTDYWDELKPVKVRFAKNLSQGMTIRLDLDTSIKLRSQAAKKGVGPTTLVRMWVIERLQESQPAKKRAPAKAATARRKRAS